MILKHNRWRCTSKSYTYNCLVKYSRIKIDLLLRNITQFMNGFFLLLLRLSLNQTVQDSLTKSDVSFRNRCQIFFMYSLQCEHSGQNKKHLYEFPISQCHTKHINRSLETKTVYYKCKHEENVLANIVQKTKNQARSKQIVTRQSTMWARNISEGNQNCSTVKKI